MNHFRRRGLQANAARIELFSVVLYGRVTQILLSRRNSTRAVNAFFFARTFGSSQRFDVTPERPAASPAIPGLARGASGRRHRIRDSEHLFLVRVWKQRARTLSGSSSASRCSSTAFSCSARDCTISFIRPRTRPCFSSCTPASGGAHSSPFWERITAFTFRRGSTQQVSG
jgi:hypothetical protein